MNMLTQENFNINEVTMSSLELVDYINESRKLDGKPVQLRHADFIAKVPKVLGGELSEKFRSVYTDTTGRTLPCYRLPKREACLMAMSYSYELQAQVFDRMTAMEEALKAKNSFDITNPAHLLQAIEVQAKLNIELTQKVAVLEPKAKGLDRIADCTNVLGIRESAKVLKVGQNQLVQYLLDHKVVYRDQYGKIQAYQKSIDQKLIHVVTSAPRLFESGEKVFTQVKLTQKLITRIAKWLEQGVAA
ncbi:phage regulatory protein/antirepressor Ant [Acinetobacter indicus]|uniref:phage antirepressor KilAC domain-containing protein n=1 Tax=Acinetobacter indicus TaxID=756892 RepID=UPI001FA6E564|nr:phage antirepressor KilAC domain-containing protein [Acinetobacter indicus]UNW10653.1 phage regulatory protein/antirepressor Ant [Acinetobacter indicus]